MKVKKIAKNQYVVKEKNLDEDLFDFYFKNKSEETGHSFVISRVVCLECSKRWISARAFCVRMEDLICPKCGEHNAIETGEYVF